MRESVGQALLLQIIVIILFAIALVFIESIAYSRAYKLKNKIINIIEEEGGYNSAASTEINAVLSEIGYQVSTGKSKCQKKAGAEDVYPGGSGARGYKYCVVKYTNSNGNNYYGVTTFMTFQFPLVENLIDIPVYGETKTFGLLD